MSLPIAEYQDQIDALCRRYGVARLDLFGSATTEAFDAQVSDADFLVDFSNPDPLGAADRYFGLRDDLASLLGRPVDVLVRRAVRNPYFLKSAERSSVTLYGA